MLVANVGLDEVCWFGAELGFSLWCGVERYFLLGFEVGVWGLGLSCGFEIGFGLWAVVFVLVLSRASCAGAG